MKTFRGEHWKSLTLCHVSLNVNDGGKEVKKSAYPVKTLSVSVRVECAGVSLAGLFNSSVVLLLLRGAQKRSALSQRTEWENARA